MQRPRPIVTLTTDFGLADAYVAEMKAAVLRECPDATLVDVTHLVPPQDVLAGAIALERAVRSFPANTVHVAVVDPGVGSERKLLVARTHEQFVIAPDNGLISWAYHRFPGVAAHELLWRPVATLSATFHGRDILGPVAGLMAAGRFEEAWLGRLDRPVLLDIRPAQTIHDAQIIHIDHYGNCTTNVPADLVSSKTTVTIAGPVRRTYSDVVPGEALALIGSSGLLEIAVRNGSAARQLKLKVGDKIELR